MPLKESQDFGSKDFDETGKRKVHNHFFPAANTGLPHLLSLEPKHAANADGFRKAVQTNADFLRGTDPKVRIASCASTSSASRKTAAHGPKT